MDGFALGGCLGPLESAKSLTALTLSNPFELGPKAVQKSCTKREGPRNHVSYTTFQKCPPMGAPNAEIWPLYVLRPFFDTLS